MNYMVPFGNVKRSLCHNKKDHLGDFIIQSMDFFVRYENRDFNRKIH